MHRLLTPQIPDRTYQNREVLTSCTNSYTTSLILPRTVRNPCTTENRKHRNALQTNVRVNRLSQTQSGLLNKQKMSIGSVD